MCALDGNDLLVIAAILGSVLSIASSVSVMTWLYRKGVHDGRNS